MFLSLFYAASAWTQSWKIRSISTILSKQLNGPLSVSFYNANSGANGNFNNLVASDICINHAKARVVEMLWSQDHLRGVAILPKQIVWLGSWMSFPPGPSLIPIDFTEVSDETLNVDDSCIVHLLVEAELVPCLAAMGSGAVPILIEKYGKPVAWKVDSCLAILLKSNLDLLTDLIMTSFMQQNLIINDFLPLLRIETVSIESQPQPFEKVKNHSRKNFFSRSKPFLTEEEWAGHVSGLKALNVLSSQASEFEVKKNRTEGKTGIAKPDLIPARSFEGNSVNGIVTPNDDPNKAVSPEKTGANNISVTPVVTNRKPSPRGSPRTSPLHLVLETDIEHKIGADRVDLSHTESVKTIETKEITTDVQSGSSVKSNDTLTEKVSAHLSPPGTSKGGLLEAKPPNVLVYSDSNVTRNNVITTLKGILNRDMYTIYELTPAEAQNGIWIENTTLLVVCGSVSRALGSLFAEYFLRGGKMLCICSDVLHIVLPTYRTAEVRENELVQFSYGKWQKIKLMHHIFCYQPSPIKKNFSTDSDEPPPAARKPTLMYPRSIDVQDLQGGNHRLEVKVLGTEETWNTPSLMIATNVKTSGVAVFSQVHLEADPNLFENDEIKFSVLKQSNQARLDIFTNLLTTTLDIEANASFNTEQSAKYTNGYFLGRHEDKFDVLNGLKQKFAGLNRVKADKLSIQFIGKNEVPNEVASETSLPILIHACPEDFSTVKYYDTLKTNKIGRLVIYAPVLTSTMDVVKNLNFGHGIAIISRKQTNAVGRSNNQWISPDGCAIFTLQLYIPLSSTLGQRLSLLQHLISVATVAAIRNIPEYQNIDIGLKWPNDIYANGSRKLGGLLVVTTVELTTGICNIGLGINLNNSKPTTCINDLIKEYNSKHNSTLPAIEYERLFALIFNEIEQLLDGIQSNKDLDPLYKQYYKYWLHTDADVNIEDRDGNKKKAKILGIDEYGYLKVQVKGRQKTEVVHPNGNSFDMIRGLIFPK